jgi:hypothetical protein
MSTTSEGLPQDISPDHFTVERELGRDGMARLVSRKLALAVLRSRWVNFDLVSARVSCSSARSPSGAHCDHAVVPPNGLSLVIVRPWTALTRSW